MLEKYIKEDVIKDTLIVFDTNILLNFYYYDERNLKYLQKFLQDISSYIWEPAHIKNEFENAREKKINEVIKQFKELGKFFKKEDKNVHDFLKEFKRNHMIDIDFFQKYKVDFNFDIQQRYDTQKQYFEECVKRIGTYKTEPLPAKAGRFALLLKQPKVVSPQDYHYFSTVILPRSYQSYFFPVNLGFVYIL